MAALRFVSSRRGIMYCVICWILIIWIEEHECEGEPH